MTEIRDGEELSIDIPEVGGACLVFPYRSSVAGGAPGATGATAILPGQSPPACAAVDVGSLAPAPPARLVAAGALPLEGSSVPARFVLRYTPDVSAVEPTAEAARDFGVHEASLHAPQPLADAGASDAGAIDIVAVGGTPATGAPTSELVTLGTLRSAHTTFTLDLRESGHDVPVHFASYGAWARQGVYVLSVEGDAFHAAAIDAFADEAAKTLSLKDPAPPAPSDLALIGARLGQIGVGILVVLAVAVGILGARTRKARG